MASSQGDSYRYFWIKVSDKEQRDAFSQQSFDLLKDLRERIAQLEQKPQTAANRQKLEALIDELGLAYMILASNMLKIQNAMTRAVLVPPAPPLTLQLFPNPDRPKQAGTYQYAVVEMPPEFDRARSEAWIRDSAIGKLWAQEAMIVQLGQIGTAPAHPPLP